MAKEEDGGLQQLRQYADLMGAVTKDILGRVEYLQAIRLGPDHAMLAFMRESTPEGIPVMTGYGLLYLYVWQVLSWRTAAKGARLELDRYVYRLQEGRERKARALIRWEYAPDSAADRPRAHVHVDARIEWGRYRLDLQHVHSPTSRIAITAVLRFLVETFGLAPACGKERWDRLLIAGEQQLHALVPIAL